MTHTPTRVPDRRTAYTAGGLLLAALAGAAALSLDDPQPPAADESRAEVKAASPTTALSLAPRRNLPVVAGTPAPVRNEQAHRVLGDDAMQPTELGGVALGGATMRGQADSESDWPLAPVDQDVELTDAQELRELDELLAEDAEFDDEYYESYDDWDADVEDVMYGYAGDEDADSGVGEPLDEGSADQLPTGFASAQLLAGFDDEFAEAVPFDSALGENAAPTEALVSALVDDDLSLEVDPVELAAQARFEGLPTLQDAGLPPEVPADSGPPTD